MCDVIEGGGDIQQQEADYLTRLLISCFANLACRVYSVERIVLQPMCVG